MKIVKSKKDILVKDYLKFESFLKNIKEDDISSNSKILEFSVCLFYNITKKEFKLLKYNDVIRLNNKIMEILKQEQPLIKFFRIKGKKYGIIPSFTDMTLAEYVDCDTDDVIKQICVLYRPVIKHIGKKYSVKQYEADMEMYDYLKNNLTLDIYFGFIAFFLNISKDLLNYTQNYILNQKGLTVEQRKILQQNGDGIASSYNSLIKIYVN